MVHAMAHSFFSWSFTLQDGPARVTDLEVPWAGESAQFRHADRTYEIGREGLALSRFVLRSGDRILARASKTNPFVRAFEIEHEGRKLRLQAVSLLGRTFELHEQGARIGRVVPTRILGRDARIDLPQELPIPLQVFLFWLVTVLWRRSRAHRG
jgi:hypothetical protein